MARLVANRYGPELDIQRLFSPADKAAHGAGVSIHSLAYFSDNRLPSAVRPPRRRHTCPGSACHAVSWLAKHATSLKAISQ